MLNLFKILSPFKCNLDKPLIYIMIIALFSIVVFMQPHALFSNDTKDQFYQLENGDYKDWHPPIMAATWNVFIKLTGVKNILWYVHFTMFIIGVYLVSQYLKTKNILLGLIFIILAFKYGMDSKILLYIWKDSGLFASFLLTAGILLNLKLAKTKIFFKTKLCIAFIIMSYGIAIRSNSVFMALPLIILLLSYLIYSKFKLIIASIFVWIGLLYTINIVNYKVLDAKKTYPLAYILVSDMIQIAYKNQNIKEIPLYLKTEQFTNDVFKDKLIYQAGITPNINRLISQSYIKVFIPLEDYNQLKKDWISLIMKNKRKYIRMKIYFFKKLLGATFLNIAILNFILIIILFNNKQIRIQDFLIYISSFCYLAPYFIFNASYDYRYIVLPKLVETTVFVYILGNMWIDLSPKLYNNKVEFLSEK